MRSSDLFATVSRSLGRLIARGGLVLRTAIAISAVAALAACASSSSVGPNGEQMVQGAPPSISGPYKLGPGDKIKVLVFGEDTLTGDHLVDPNGYVGVPLVGQVLVMGESTDSVANVIATHLKKDFLRDPKVVVQLVETRPYFITGQVHKPGEYPYRPNLTLQSAIAIAGGPTFRASPRYFYVTRPSPATRYEVETSQPYNVQPGDVIDVPERLF